jgi:hypothetical protein
MVPFVHIFTLFFRTLQALYFYSKVFVF